MPLNLQVGAYHLHMIFFYVKLSRVAPDQTETFNRASWAEINLYTAPLVSGLGY